MNVYRVSPYVHSLSLDERTDLVGHPFFLEYSVIEGELLAIFNELRKLPASAASLQRSLTIEPAIIEQALKFLETRHFILVDGESEEVRIRRHVAASRDAHLGNRGGAKGQARTFRDYAAVKLDALKELLPFGSTKKVKAVLLGGCLTQVAAQALEQLAPAYGINMTVEASWPDRLESMQLDGIDIIVFQPFTYWLIAPFWDGAAFLSDTERGARLATMKEYLQLALSGILPRITGRLLLVQGISTPIFSPLGRTEFRQTNNFSRAVFELNQTIADAIRESPDAMLIDEEHLLSNAGKLQLMDDSVSLTGHHGPLDLELNPSPVEGSRREAFGVDEANRAARLFAQAYLDAFVMWSGIGRVKCVIVDLDNTLWPGIAGEGGLQLTEANTMELWVGTIGGLHQALKILKQRGVLLCFCSRNDEADVARTWHQLEDLADGNGWTHLLRRDDFVAGKVNWERKSTNISEILDALGVSPDAAVFVDDSSAEREEVRAALPTLRVLGENMLLVRAALLNDPCLQNDMQTSESKSRTEMVKAQLQRDAVRKQAGDGQAFLRNLDVHLKITRIRSHARLPRIVELIQRTNQFNTTLTRFNRQEVLDIMNHPHGSVYALEVTDRFASYGLVGTCLLRGDAISSFVLSCRVIPLCVAVPFLSAVLLRQRRTPISGAIVEGPRNQPCRELYRDAGFEAIGSGNYLLADLERLKRIDPTLYDIDFDEGLDKDETASTPPQGARKHAAQPTFSFGED